MALDTKIAHEGTVPHLSDAPTVTPSSSSDTEEKIKSAKNGLTDEVTLEKSENEDGVGDGPVVARFSTAASKMNQSERLEQHRTREDGSEYPSGLKLILITVALCLAVFLMALDNSIIATAIPKITDQFQSLSDVGWYGSAYLLTTAALQLLFGRFYTFFSIKWLFLFAIAIFEIGSLICGIAPNSIALILGRAIAGVGSAGIFSGALIILAHTVPLEKRPMYAGFVGSMYGIASVSGPLLGGVFTDEVTWRWCFYINLPIGAITVAVITAFFPDPQRTPVKNEGWTQRFKQFDPLGTIIFMPAVVSLLLALQWGGTKYEWDSGRIIGLLVVFAVLIIAFIVIQWLMQENATVPPRIFLRQTVWSSAAFAFCTGAGFLLMVYFLPIWFQAVKGASAVGSGIMNLPMLIAVVICSIGAGICVTVFGYYNPFMIFGTVLGSIGYGILTTFRPDISSAKWIGYQIIAGAGVGLAMQQPLMAVQTVLDIKDIPIGTSLIAFMQMLGGALFVSVGQTVFTNSLLDGLSEKVPDLDPNIVLMAGATSIKSLIPVEFLDAVIQIYSDALTDAFSVSAACAAIAIIPCLFVQWKSVKGRPTDMAVA